MATEKVILEDTAPVGQDCTTLQYTVLKFNGSGQLVPAGAGDKGFVLQDNPAAAGRAGTYALVGITKVVYGGTIAAGDYLASNGSGAAVTAANTVTPTGGSYAAGTAGQHIIGQALVAGVAGDIGRMIIRAGLA